MQVPSLWLAAALIFGTEWAALPPAPVVDIRGQAPTQEHPPSVQQPQFSVEATLVNVPVLVTDEDGRVLAGLKRENFRLLDQGKTQNILHFERSTAPLTTVLLIEYSSASYDYYAHKAASWASVFLDHLEPKDWVALVTYDLHSTVRTDFTHNRAELRSSLTSLGFPMFRESNLFDALMQTLDQLDQVSGRKSILLLSTGSNSFSTATLDDVLARLKASNVTIFTVGLAEQESVRRQNSGIGYLQAKSWLRSFSELTGGIASFPRFPAEIPEIFRDVAGFLRNEYLLSFSPEPSARDGSYHRLSVRVVDATGKPLTVVDEKGRRRKVSVVARPGYVAEPPGKRSLVHDS